MGIKRKDLVSTHMLAEYCPNKEGAGSAIYNYLALELFDDSEFDSR